MTETEARRWHVSETHLGGSPTTATPIEEKPARSALATPRPPLLPLWHRIVSGQSFAWRVRWVRNRIRWARRGAARRTLRWLRLHPEIGSAAHSGALGRLAFTVLRERARRRQPPSHGHRPRIAVANQVTIAPALQHRFDSVNLECHDGPPVTLTGAGGDAVVTAIGPARRLDAVLGPVPLRQWNPSTFQQTPTDGPVGLAEVLDTTHTPSTRLLRAHRARAVVCERDDARASGVAALAIVQLATAGVVLVGELPASEVDLIGAALAEAITGTTADDLADDRRREMHSVRLRRAALARHSPRGWWQTVGAEIGADVEATPQISVLLPSNRPDDVVDAARSVARQVGVDVELVVGLHGSHMPAALDDQLADAFSGDLVICRCSDDLNLGAVMNELTAAATRDLVSKWDDDDWYDVAHLADLAWALDYSNAALVGKAAEFVHLETLGITIRRFATGSERPSTTIAGGTLLMTREELDEIGWECVPRQVDRRLIDALQQRGRPIYRTHGLGYVLRRRSAAMNDHTWLVGDDYFLRQASDQRPGLDLDFAGFEVSS